MFMRPPPDETSAGLMERKQIRGPNFLIAVILFSKNNGQPQFNPKTERAAAEKIADP